MGMMKRIKLLLVAVLSVFSLASYAAGNFAVVNVQDAIAKSDTAKLWIKKFESEQSNAKADLQALEAELKSLQEKFKKDQAILSEEEKRKTNKIMQDKYEELQFRGKQLQKEYKAGQQELLKSMFPKVQKAITDLMKTDGYDMILHREAVLTVSPSLDITDKLVEQLNKAK